MKRRPFAVDRLALRAFAADAQAQLVEATVDVVALRRIEAVAAVLGFQAGQIADFRAQVSSLAAGIMLWLVYGLLISDLPLIAANLVRAVIQTQADREAEAAIRRLIAEALDGTAV